MGRFLFLTAVAIAAYKYISRSNRKAIAPPGATVRIGNTEVLAPLTQTNQEQHAEVVPKRSPATEAEAYR